MYVLGTAAALRLLPRRTPVWWCAAVSFAASLGLLALSGWYVLGTLLVAVCALVYKKFARPVDSRQVPIDVGV